MYLYYVPIYAIHESVIKIRKLTFWELTFWEVDILGVDISGVDILGVDILRLTPIIYIRGVGQAHIVMFYS